MKLSLDELKVDSYAVQANETELAEVKGGTYWLCVDLAIAVAGLGVAAWGVSSSKSKSSSSAPDSGAMIYGADSVRYNGAMIYYPDSVYIGSGGN